MSFGGFGGFGSNNQSSSGGFGFGANKTNTTSGFGSGFGSSNTNTSGSTLFGSGSTGGFGSGGGFGSTSNTTFGGSSAFGSNSGGGSGGGLFGASNTTSNTGGGFGGFGSTPSNPSTSFGSGGGGGLFGNQSKPAATTFGSTGTTGGSIFGGGGTSSGTGAFGTSSTGAFGAPSSTALSTNVGDPPGTASVAFSAYQEKEPNGTLNNTFQNLLFQEAYKKWSADELRLVDYMQGRRHGNASGAGAFGIGSGFGGATGFVNTTPGFGSGSTGGGLFSNTTNTSTAGGGFGSTTATSGGFGSTSSGGGLFGQNKPATGGGLFGGNTSSSFGGFGGNTNTTGAFGSNTSGGGLFGSNTATQNKPSGLGGFGSANTATTNAFGSTNTNAGFGSNATNTTGGGLFGGGSNTQSNTSGGLFGATSQQSNTTGGGFGGGFGATNQQSSTGSGLFGNANQQKPGGLFGSSTTTGTTGGGLFGSSTNTTSNAFGGSNTQSTGGGLFGAAKPATTGSGLFGASMQQQQNTSSTGGGLFGGLGQNNQNQQSTGSGLFGSQNQNQAKPSIFGASTTQTTGSGLFGSAQNTNQGGSSLFGGNTNQQQQQNAGLGSSLFATSQNNAQAGQQSLTASINDMSAYGTSSLFSNMGGNEPQNPGPLATPLSSKSKPRRSSILPMYKLNPASASRFSTPQKRGGFGFSYSTYGTPGSASSVNSTPGGMNQSLLLSSSTKGLKTSVSTSNLRRSFNAEDSILTPGAFSTSNQRFGSVKKLVINREMRSDLFSSPQKDKTSDPARGSRLRKHVSFEDSNSEADSTPLQLPAPPEEPKPSPQNGSTPTIGNISNGSSSNGASNNTQEATEPSRSTQVATTSSTLTNSSGPIPGQYWMRPSMEDILRMPRADRSAVPDFTVGRVNVGSVQFLIPVDLTAIDVENIFRDIIELEPRSATVYKTPSKKPPVGKGLNVPAKISLEQSWPRSKKGDGKGAMRLKKHVDRLRRIPDTTFLDYNQDTGVWAFRVEHFTTYGLDYDDDDESDVEPSTTVTSFSNEPQSNPSTQFVTEEVLSPDFNPDDDTFEFRRKRRALPGAFDVDHDLDYEPGASAVEVIPQLQSFLGDRSVDSVSNELVPVSNEVEMEEEFAVAAGQDMASPTPGNRLAAEHEYSSPEQERFSDNVPETPGGIMRARMRAIKDTAVPTNLRVADGDDWQDMLQRTISPQKRDRAMLKSLNAEDNYESLRESVRENSLPPRNRMVSDSRGFATSIDLMNSLFDRAKGPLAKGPAKGFVKVGV